MKIRILRSVLLGMALLLCMPSLASEYHFKRYGMFDGLPTQRVNCCMQDSRGFMWFGTAIGLACFDGTIFRTHIPARGDGSVLRGRSVTGLVQGSDGRLWIATNQGLYCYDIQADRLLSPEAMGWPREELLGLALDAEEHLWIRTNWFFYRLDTSTNESHQYAPDKYFQPTDFVVTSSGVLWALTVDGHINRYNAADDTFTPYTVIPDDRDGRMKVLAKGVEREDGRIMIMTCQDGARLFSPTTKEVETLFTRYGEQPPAFTHTMMKRNEHEYWLATEEGVFIWTDEDGSQSMTQLTVNGGDASSLSDNAIHALCQDKEGGVWVATAFGGISYMSSDQSSFQHIRLENAQGYVQSRVARSIVSSADGTLWIGAEDGGLYSYDTSTQTVTAHNHLSWGGQPLPVNIQSLLMVDGRLWIGSFDGSIYIYDMAAGRITHRLPLPFSFPVDMMLTDDGHVYVATTIALLEMEASPDGEGGFNFRKVEGLPGGFSHYLYKDQRGDIWVAMLGQGVWRLKGKTAGRGRREWEKVDFPNEFMCTIFQDSRGTIWVGSQTNGLFRYDAETHRGMPSHNILHQDGLGVYRIIEDNRGVLWISTSNGLYSYNLQNENVIRYGLSSILTSPQFNYNSGYVDSTGRIFFGTLDGIVSFLPEKVRQPEADLTVYFSDYTNDGTSFSVRFSVPVYSLQETLWFRYRLKGVDKDWVVVQGQPQIRYTNLSPGSYRLEVESAFQNGNWTGQYSELQVEIKAPWYATALAKWAYLLMGLAVVYLSVMRYRHRQRERRMAEAEHLRAEHERELTQEKIKFFTAITHEIRTPLTLIMTPLESLISTFSAEKAKHVLPLMLRNARELLNLVNQILDFRKLEQGGSRLELSHGDFNEFCSAVMQMFSEMAQKKQIAFTTNIEGPLYMNFDKDKMQRVVMNLLSNAFKYTPDGGNIRVETYVDGHQCTLVVRDSGVGISPADLPHVFDLFYQSEAMRDASLEGQMAVGSGIGLHLVKEFVGLHHGQVGVESQNDKNSGPTGTTFTVTFPTDLNKTVGKMGDQAEEDVTAEDADAKPAEEAAMEEAGKAKPTVLLVDDNEEFRQYLTLELSDSYRLLQASNGQEALELCQEREIDVVVSDVMMPLMDGMELCKRLKDNVKTSHFFVILLTAKVGEQYRLTGYKAGADYYIAKPFNVEILRDRIAYLVNLRKQRHDIFLQDVEVVPEEMTNSKLDEELYDKAVKLVTQNMANEEYSVEQFSSDMCMSRMTLYRKIQNITGQKPLEFIRAIRLKRAAHLLKTTDYSIVEIAEMVGFGTPRNFSKNFKLLYGVSPSEYKNK